MECQECEYVMPLEASDSMVKAAKTELRRLREFNKEPAVKRKVSGDERIRAIWREMAWQCMKDMPVTLSHGVRRR